MLQHPFGNDDELGEGRMMRQWPLAYLVQTYKKYLRPAHGQTMRIYSSHSTLYIFEHSDFHKNTKYALVLTTV